VRRTASSELLSFDPEDHRLFRGVGYPVGHHEKLTIFLESPYDWQETARSTTSPAGGCNNMNMRFLGLVSLVILGVLLQTAESQQKTARRGVERSVVVPEDNSPFQVQERDTVRLTGKGIAGAKFQIKINGPARLVAINEIFPRRNGHPLIGLGNQEFEVKPTGRGRVHVTITSTPPIPGEKPTVETYQFEVE
jgi:hypothetical protein